VTTVVTVPDIRAVAWRCRWHMDRFEFSCPECGVVATRDSDDESRKFPEKCPCGLRLRLRVVERREPRSSLAS